MLLELQNVAVRLGGRSIIEGVSLTLAPGQCLALSGASGCGKTTLLRAIAGLVEADGHIVQRARRFAYLFQEPRLLPWLTARENVRLVRPEAGDETIDELLAALALRPGDGDKYPVELSGGMRQRVALARALIGQPDLLLMDEPFSALDTRLRRELQGRIAGLVDSGLAVVLVSHDAEEVVRLAQRVYCLGGSPATVQQVIDLPSPYADRDLLWLQHHSAHPVLQGIEAAVLRQ